jgi:phage shock protein E
MKPFKLVPLLLVAGAILALLVLNAPAELSEAEACAQVRRGALVVDVRTVEEFNSQRLTNVINIPLAVVKEKLPAVVTNQSEVVLLHCRSGRRSSAAESELRALGYTNVFNIGSFERARKILDCAAK